MNFRRRQIAVALLALAVTGCKVNQKKEVQRYRDVLDSTVPRVPAYTEDEPLSLPRAMALANQNNEQLGLRGEDYVQALIQKNRVAADFLPTVSFQPNFTIEQRATGNAATSTGPGGSGISGNNANTSNSGGGGFRDVGNTSQRLEASVVGNINLYRGGADVANLEAARANIAQRRELLLDLQATVLLNVAEVYYQVLRSERSVDVLRNTLKLQEARLADVQQQFNNGLAIRLSVEQTRAQVDATRVQLVQAESDVRNGRSTLSLLVGVPSVKGKLTDEVVAPDRRDPEEAYEREAAETRQDLRAAHAGIVAARKGVDVAFAQYYPSVSLNVSGFLYREFFSDASKWNAILAANLPIFSAGIIESDVRAAWSRLRQAALNESLVRRQVLHDVQTAYENLETAERRIKELEDQVKASEESLRQAQNAFKNSLAINLDVLVSQDQLLNSELQLTSARFDRTILYLDLLRAVGRLPQTIAGESPSTRPTTNPATAPVAVVR
jgi:outer membrane protein